MLSIYTNRPVLAFQPKSAGLRLPRVPIKSILQSLRRGAKKPAPVAASPAKPLSAFEQLMSAAETQARPKPLPGATSRLGRAFEYAGKHPFKVGIPVVSTFGALAAAGPALGAVPDMAREVADSAGRGVNTITDKAKGLGQAATDQVKGVHKNLMQTPYSAPATPAEIQAKTPPVTTPTAPEVTPPDTTAADMFGQAKEHLGKYAPYYAAGGVGLAGVLAMLRHQKKKREEEEMWLPKEATAAAFVAEHPFVAGFLAKCARAKLAPAATMTKVALAISLDENIANEFSLAFGEEFTKQAGFWSTLGNGLTTMGRQAAGLGATVAGGIGTLGAGAVSAAGHTWNTAAPLANRAANWTNSALGGSADYWSKPKQFDMTGPDQLTGDVARFTGAAAMDTIDPHNLTNVQRQPGQDWLDGAAQQIREQGPADKGLLGSILPQRANNVLEEINNRPEVTDNVRNASRALWQAGSGVLANTANPVQRFTNPIVKGTLGSLGVADATTAAKNYFTDQPVTRGTNFEGITGVSNDPVYQEQAATQRRFDTMSPADRQTFDASVAKQTQALIGMGVSPERAKLVAESEAFDRFGSSQPQPPATGSPPQGQPLQGQPQQGQPTGQWQPGPPLKAENYPQGKPGQWQPGPPMKAENYQQGQPGTASPFQPETAAPATTDGSPFQPETPEGAAGPETLDPKRIAAASEQVALSAKDPAQQQQALQTSVKASVQASGVDPKQIEDAAKTGQLPPDAAAKVQADIAAANPEAPPEGIFEMYEKMDDWKKFAMWLGIGAGAIGLIGTMAGGGPMAWLMTALGLGGAGIMASNAGMLGDTAQGMTQGISDTVMDFFGNDKPPAAGETAADGSVAPVAPVRPAPATDPSQQPAENATNPNIPQQSPQGQPQAQAQPQPAAATQAVPADPHAATLQRVAQKFPNIPTNEGTPGVLDDDDMKSYLGKYVRDPNSGIDFGELQRMSQELDSEGKKKMLAALLAREQEWDYNFASAEQDARMQQLKALAQQSPVPA